MSTIFAIRSHAVVDLDGEIKYKAIPFKTEVRPGTKEEKRFYRVGVCSGATWADSLPCQTGKYYFESEQDYINISSNPYKEPEPECL